MKCSQYYLTKMQKVILFYNGLEVLTRQILDSKGATPTKTAADAKLAIQEMAEYSQKWYNKTSRTKSTKTFDGLAAIQAQLNNLGREIKKALQARGFGSLPSSTETNLRDHVKSISTSVEADMTLIRRIGSSQYTKGLYVPQYLDAYSYGATRIDNSLPRKEKDPRSFTLPCYINNVCFKNALADLGASVSVMPLSTYLNLDFIILDMPEDVKVSLILGRPFFSTVYAKIDVFKRKITSRVGDDKIIFKSVKPASSLIKRVYMLSLRESMELDLEARLMGETLMLNRSIDLLYRDYIELNDLNVPFRRDQVDDLMPTIEEGEVVDQHMIEEVKAKNDNKMVSKIFGYPNDYDEDKKIRIECAYNLKFLCMIGFEFVHANFFPNLPINVMLKKFYNLIMKDKIEFRGRNELGNFTNVPIFIGNFYVITGFIVVEDMDPYLDEGMGEVVVGEPFCEVSCVETRRFDGIITIHVVGYAKSQGKRPAAFCLIDLVCCKTLQGHTGK
ncbi:hypothetical protein Tco_0034143, partial [Tanacetum coccineum]